MVSMLFLALWHRRQHRAWLVLSGVFLALSTLTKLFTGILAPIFLIGLLAVGYPHLKEGRDWRRFLQPAFIWGLSASVVLIIAVLALVKIENLAQLVAPHLSAREIDVYQTEDNTIWWYIKAVPGIVLLAFIGLGMGLTHKSWLTLYPAAWTLTAFALLTQHAPVWSHQQLLVTIPAAMLASIAVGESLRFLAIKLKEREAHWRTILLRAIPAILFVGVFAIHFPRAIQEFDLHPRVGMRETSAEMTVLALMNEYADETHWIVTDVPVFAFWLGKPVPPNLAVFSSKRLLTANLTEGDVIQAILDYHPEWVLLGRFELPAVQEYLDEHYHLSYDKKQYMLYLRPDLISAE
jgi:4-amino-4-deoxy-L-arabinose transferase-like glycosyltransferase